MLLPPDLELMAHQAKLLASASDGHRTFLLADEPGLGKTAQALLAAQVADAYPLLAIVPNVVKTNWAREAAMWTPNRTVTVVHGDGQDVDGFADIVVVNYEVLDRHVRWMGEHGFRGLVVDEAHYIKNKKSQRSQNVLEVSDRIRQRVARPLMMALTGTPLINDIDDFRAIWQMLGWVEEKKPGNVLMAELEETGFTPADHAFYPAARQAVVDLGIVRRRKVDVAADIPARRIADLPVELEGPMGRSIREAERQLAQRLVGRYRAALEHRRPGASVLGEDGIDHELVRRVAEREVAEGSEAEDRRQRVHDGPQDRAGEGRAGRRLRRPAGPQRGQGRLLRQAPRRDGRRRGPLRAARRRLHVHPRRPDAHGARRGDRLLHQRPRRPRHRLLADRGRRRHQPPGLVQRRARRALVDQRRADPGDRPGPPDRPDRAGHRLADHRRPDHRREDRRADRRQGRPRRPRARRRRRAGRLRHGRRTGRDPGRDPHRGAHRDPDAQG